MCEATLSLAPPPRKKSSFVINYANLPVLTCPTLTAAWVH